MRHSSCTCWDVQTLAILVDKLVWLSCTTFRLPSRWGIICNFFLKDSALWPLNITHFTFMIAHDDISAKAWFIFFIAYETDVACHRRLVSILSSVISHEAYFICTRHYTSLWDESCLAASVSKAFVWAFKACSSSCVVYVHTCIRHDAPTSRRQNKDKRAAERASKREWDIFFSTKRRANDELKQKERYSPQLSSSLLHACQSYDWGFQRVLPFWSSRLPSALRVLSVSSFHLLFALWALPSSSYNRKHFIISHGGSGEPGSVKLDWWERKKMGGGKQQDSSERLARTFTHTPSRTRNFLTKTHLCVQ